MQKTYKSLQPAGRGETNAPRAVGWSRQDILTKARALLSVGGSQARREIVQTALQLDQLLAGGTENVR